jgi:hypothetical protein
LATVNRLAFVLELNNSISVKVKASLYFECGGRSKAAIFVGNFVTGNVTKCIFVSNDTNAGMPYKERLSASLNTKLKFCIEL